MDEIRHLAIILYIKLGSHSVFATFGCHPWLALSNLGKYVMLQVPLQERGLETSLWRMERRVVDVQEGVESYNSCWVSLQVHNTVQSQSAGHRRWGCWLIMFFLCVSGIICITQHSRVGKLLCLCRGKRRTKSKMLSPLVCEANNESISNLCLMFYLISQATIVSLITLFP